MNCPSCGCQMTMGYLRGNKGYALLWTEDPFKMTSFTLGEDFWLCKETDVDKPVAYLCRACKQILLKYR